MVQAGRQRLFELKPNVWASLSCLPSNHIAGHGQERDLDFPWQAPPVSGKPCQFVIIRVNLD